MSQPIQGPQQTVVIQQAPGTSGLAIAGLIFSILGWLTCGALCIPGALFSFLGMLSRGPKGVAIAGLVVGFPGVLFFLFVGLGIIMAFLGIGAAATATVAELEKASIEAQSQMQGQADNDLQQPEDATPGSVENAIFERPDEIELEPIVQQQPASPPASDSPASSERESPAVADLTEMDGPGTVVQDSQATDPNEAAKWRTWATADGKFSIEAKFVSFTGGTLTLEKKDGTTIDVQLDILCSDDQDFVKQRKWNTPTNSK